MIQQEFTENHKHTLNCNAWYLHIYILLSIAAKACMYEKFVKYPVKKRPGKISNWKNIVSWLTIFCIRNNDNL